MTEKKIKYFMLQFIKAYKYQICLTAILIIAVFFRFYKITQMPPGLYPDEAMNGNNALEAVATNNFKIFYPENNGREGLFINIQAFSVAFWGPEPWALRSVSAIFGILTVLGLYLLAKELFRKFQISPNSAIIIALLSSFFLAVSFWHTNFSRIGFRAIMLPFLTTFSFYFLFKGFRRGKILDFVWAGIFMGLGFHTYIAFRIVPFVVIAVLILKLIELIKGSPSINSETNLIFPERSVAESKDDVRKENIKEFLLSILIYGLFALLAVLPIFYYFYAHPADFIGRAGQVSVFASQDKFAELTKSALLTFGQFNIFGDTNWRHNYAGSPLLFWPVGIFFLIGTWICIKNCFNYFSSLFPFLSFPWKRESGLESNLDSRLRGNDKGWGGNNDIVFPFLMLWFFAMLAPSILSTEGLPHALRSIGAIPPTFIIAGLGAYVLADFANRRWFLHINKKLITVFYAMIILTIGLAGYQKYFIDYADNPNIKGAFADNYVKIGQFINSLPQDMKKYVVVNAGGTLVNDIPMSTQTTMFITDSYRKANQLEKNIYYILVNEIEKPNFYNEKSYVIIPLEKDDAILEKLRSFAPGKLNKGENFDYIIK